MERLTDTCDVSHQSEIHLHQFLTMVSLDNDEASTLQLAKDFCYQSDSSLDHRLALELFYVNGCEKELRDFIEINRQSVLYINRQTATLYELMVDGRNYQSIHHIRTFAKSLTCDQPELACLRYFLYIELDCSVYNYDQVGYYLNKIQQLLPKIDNPLLLSFFNMRMHTYLFIYYWKRNELILARKHAYEALQIPNHMKHKADLHKYLALSYIYEDFESCIFHIEEAKQMADRLADKVLFNQITSITHPFICAYFGEVDGIHTSDPIEQAHVEIVRGNTNRAKRLLEALRVITPFTQYYLGLITKRQHFFIHSYQEFMEKRSDHFFARLPLQAYHMP
ncbi:hypothetical protein J416_10036 [Gracilibacillus halophilus YIM-C55.5]|uniref:Uncharacterized protein n=1 Tax=Gracilibacillus halophilus YIM-C55.5 TaxID=1308866 RepID=N4W8I0_9BACI|nr:AimR family lysis-lysogeny pheromone receptor [Gracilibacillus halophilus]ENH96563.1 hypothetical protein J416_10036 [Gracilibacillus halophilus YIM-C55.5]